MTGRFLAAHIILAFGIVIIAAGPLLPWQAWVGLIAIVSAAIITPAGGKP